MWKSAKKRSRPEFQLARYCFFLHRLSIYKAEIINLLLEQTKQMDPTSTKYNSGTPFTNMI